MEARTSMSDSEQSASSTVVLWGTLLVALIFLFGVGSYNLLSSRTAIALPPISLTAANMSQTSDGRISLSLQVRNTGVEEEVVTGSFENFFASQILFQPKTVSPGETSLGVSHSSWLVAAFDGSSGYVDVANSVSINPRNLSVEVAFEYHGETPDQQMIVGKGSAHGNSFYFYTYRSVNNINDFVVYQNDTRHDYQLGDIFFPGKWYDVVFTLDGHNVTSYVNGLFVARWATQVQFQGNQEDLLIGRCSCGGYYFNGSMAFVRLYDRALSPDDVRTNYATTHALTDGLVLWLQFNQTASNITPDLSGNRNDGLINGFIATSTPLSTGSWYNVTVTATMKSGVKYSVTSSVLVTSDPVLS